MSGKEGHFTSLLLNCSDVGHRALALAILQRTVDFENVEVQHGAKESMSILKKEGKGRLVYNEKSLPIKSEQSSESTSPASADDSCGQDKEPDNVESASSVELHGAPISESGDRAVGDEHGTAKGSVSSSHESKRGGMQHQRISAFLVSGMCIHLSSPYHVRLTGLEIICLFLFDFYSGGIKILARW